MNQGEDQREIAKEILTASVAIPAEGVEVDPPQSTKVQIVPTPISVSSPKPKVTPPPPAPVKIQAPSPLPSSVASAPTSTSPLPPSVPPAQPVESSQPPPPPQPPAEKININTANLEELDQITGVGSAIAQRIVDYRQNVSLFYYVEDLKNVDGIGDVNFEKMRDEITVGDVVAPTPTPPPAPTPTPSPSPPPQEPETEKININTASIEELDQITGVGPAIAKNIIDYRTEHGPFQSIEEIKSVNGIADAKFEGMKDEITI